MVDSYLFVAIFISSVFTVRKQLNCLAVAIFMQVHYVKVKVVSKSQSNATGEFLINQFEVVFSIVGDPRLALVAVLKNRITHADQVCD